MIFGYTTHNQEVMRCNEYTTNFRILSRARAIKPYVRNRRAKKKSTFSCAIACERQREVIYAKNKNYNGLAYRHRVKRRRRAEFRGKLKTQVEQQLAKI